ncbi:MAG: hypothetical protein WDM77_06455 [Steroidobacteraceae bacterium]
MTTNTSLRLLPVTEILSARGARRTKLYDDIKRGTWPPLVKLGRASVQPQHEVELMVAAIVAGKTDDELQGLVRKVVANRVTAFETLSGRAA